MRRLIEESELDAIVEAKVRAVLTEMLGLHSASQNTPKWSSPKQTAAALGVTPYSLARMRREGWFTESVHYRAANANPLATGSGCRYEYNVEKCQERRSQPRSKWLKSKK